MSVFIGGASNIQKLIELLQQPTAGATYQLTVDTTPVQLSSQSFKVKTITIKADDDNTGNVFVGFDDTVSPTNGFRLAAGQGLELLIDDVSKVWVVADTAGQKVHVLVLYSGTETFPSGTGGGGTTFSSA